MHVKNTVSGRQRATIHRSKRYSVTPRVTCQGSLQTPFYSCSLSLLRRSPTSLLLRHPIFVSMQASNHVGIVFLHPISDQDMPIAGQDMTISACSSQHAHLRRYHGRPRIADRLPRLGNSVPEAGGHGRRLHGLQLLLESLDRRSVGDCVVPGVRNSQHLERKNDRARRREGTEKRRKKFRCS